jgi:hypothetical protein
MHSVLKFLCITRWLLLNDNYGLRCVFVLFLRLQIIVIEHASLSNDNDRTSQMLSHWNETVVGFIVQIYTRDQGSPFKHCRFPVSL